MKNFFESKSVAIVGASANPKKLGHQLTKNLIKGGYEGAIFPVNLKEKKILGLPVYQSVLDIHRKIDIAVIIVPREVVSMVLRQCVHKEIPYVLIISAGFAEKDALGVRLQKELIEITSRTKTKIIGPNCLGLIDTANQMNLSFAATAVKKGTISLILQSGAMGAAIFDWAKENNIGIAKFMSLGNKVHFNEIDALEILKEDEQTKIIAIYLEEISDPVRFLVKSEEISRQKPIIILKGGQTQAGARAASSHTAALSGSPVLNEAIFTQANLITATSFEELLNFLEIFDRKVFNLTENNLAIITNAGGPGILGADAASENGLKLPKLLKKEQNLLAKKIKNFANLQNPIDLGGDADAESFFKSISFIEELRQFSALMIILTPQSMTEIEETAHAIALFRTSKKPIVACFLGGEKMKKGLKILNKYRIPSYDDPALAIGILGKIYRYYTRRQKFSKLIEIKPVINQTPFTDEEIIKNYQIPFSKTFYVQGDAEVMGHVEEIGFPLVYKTAKKILHRGKKHLVGLNINDRHSLQRAIQTIGFPGFIQEMVDSPFEIIIGARRDPNFGPLVVFGQGGIFTEEQADTNIRLMPLTERDLDEMIKMTKIWSAISDLEVESLIKSIIIKVAKIIIENPQIQEIELNPIKVINKNIKAVDINVVRKND